MKAFGNARGKLITELSNGGAFTEIIRRFNTSLRGQEADYALTAEATATPLRVKRFLSANASRAADQTIPMNFQTNVSVPYAKLGQEGPQDPTQENEYAGFEDFFGPNEQTPRAMYVRAREQANALAPAAGFSSEVKALLTHIMHHYAMYENAQVTPHGEGPEDKHKFHVMIKMSPQDAVMTILSAADVTGLSTWLAVPGNRRTLREAYLRVLPPSGRASAVTDDTLPGELTPALDARSTLDARNNRDNRVLLDVMDQDGDTFTVPLGQGDSAAINILHPRRSNRVPVYAGDQQYWVVIEQRSANHPLNDPTQVKDKAKRDLVTALIAKLQKL